MAEASPGRITRGTPEFRRTTLALVASGVSTFALLYCVQALLPVFSLDFGVSAATSSLALSLSTGVLAFAMLGASALSETLGRKPMMLAALALSAVLNLLSAVQQSWGGFLAIRALMGLTMSGVPAVAMAYVSEEVDAGSIGLSMGLYIAGNAVGGMSGRLLVGAISDVASWRWAVVAIGGVGVLSTLVFWRSLPPSRHFTARPLAAGPLLAAYVLHLRDAAMPWLLLLGFLLSGSFVTIYNYVGYRLLLPPFLLSQTAIGLLFSVYLVGIVASPVVGDIANRLGRRRVLWVAMAIMLAGTLITLSGRVPGILMGVAVMTFGFFGAHSICSAWVGARARQARAQASSLYLFFYYFGSSVVGSVGGIAWERGGWPGVVTLTGSLITIGLGASVRLARIPPLVVSRGTCGQPSGAA